MGGTATAAVGLKLKRAWSWQTRTTSFEAADILNISVSLDGWVIYKYGAPPKKRQHPFNLAGLVVPFVYPQMNKEGNLNGTPCQCCQSTYWAVHTLALGEPENWIPLLYQLSWCQYLDWYCLLFVFEWAPGFLMVFRTMVGRQLAMENALENQYR